MRAILAAGMLLVLAALGVYGTWSATLPARPAAAAAPANGGALVYRQGTFSVRLAELPCPFYEVREALEAEGVPPAKWAFITEGGRVHTGCWAPDGTGEILTQDQDGRGGSLPQEWFKREAAEGVR